MTTPKEEDIVHLLSSDEELIPIPTRACQFSSFLSVALRRREDFGGFVSGKHQREEEKDFIVLRVPNVSSKTLSIIVEYLNHRDSMQERKEMKLKRRLRRREDGFTSSSSRSQGATSAESKCKRHRLRARAASVASLIALKGAIASFRARRLTP